LTCGFRSRYRSAFKRSIAVKTLSLPRSASANGDLPFNGVNRRKVTVVAPQRQCQRRFASIPVGGSYQFPLPMLQMVVRMRLFAASCATAFAQQQCDLVSRNESAALKRSAYPLAIPPLCLANAPWTSCDNPKLNCYIAYRSALPAVARAIKAKNAIITLSITLNSLDYEKLNCYITSCLPKRTRHRHTAPSASNPCRSR
jgi:hypothetical protein